MDEDTLNETKYKNPDLNIQQAKKTITAANNTTVETIRTVKLEITPERVTNGRHETQQMFTIYFYVTECNHNILGIPFFEESMETINLNTIKLTINSNTIVDNDITFSVSGTKGYPYYSHIYPIYNKELIYFKNNQHKCITFPIRIFPRMEKLNKNVIHGSLHYFEPMHEYRIISFTDFKHLSLEKEHFVDIFLMNKSQHRISIKKDFLISSAKI